MTDRELLELAAKAAGLHIDDWICDMAVMYFWDGDPQNPERNHHYWSPLTDDGDALRLAVKLKLELEFGSNFVNVGRSVDVGEWYLAQDSSGDMHSATRRALVRAAAEIGRRMQHE